MANSRELDLAALFQAAADRDARVLAVLEDPDIDPEFARVRASHILRGEA